MHLQVVGLNLRSRQHWVIGDVHSCHQPLCNLLATHAGFDAAGQPDLSISDPFLEAYDGHFGRIVVGHTPRPQVERLGAIFLIDTGAFYGGCLSAYCPQTDAVVQVEGAATDAVLAGVGPC